ncbi:MAG: D-2-hydroxyacid dehydrogenase [Nitrospirota bacterium]
MKIAIPSHIARDYGAHLRRAYPDADIIPLAIHRRESPFRKVLRRCAEYGLPYHTYERLQPWIGRRPSFSFSLDGKPLSAPASDVQGLLATWMMEYDSLKQLLPLLPGLRWLHSTKSGVEHLPGECLGNRSLTVTASRGAHSRRIAEFVMGLIYCFGKNYLGHRALQQKRRWDQLPSLDIEGKQVAVLGAGSIGREVARKARAGGMRVSGVSLRGRPDRLFERVYLPEQLGDALRGADFIVVCLPLTRETTGFIGAEALARMKRTAYLINIARDRIVDREALVRALRTGALAGAAIDAVADDFLPRSHPYYRLDNLLITHHCAYRGETPAAALLGRFEENLGRFLAGEPLIDTIDPEKGY